MGILIGVILLLIFASLFSKSFAVTSGPFALLVELIFLAFVLFLAGGIIYYQMAGKYPF